MNSGLRWIFGVCAVVSLIMVAVALHFWGAEEIRAEPGEVFFLTFAGALWFVVATRLFAWLGLSFHDDVAERGNVAALAALGGALMAVAIIYIGGSIGEGPSYLNNVFCAGLGTAGLFVLWILLELGGKVSMSIAEERDLASGLRLGGFLLAAGLVLGRAAAGNWYSMAATIQDFFHDAWPAAVLCVVALLVERFARPIRHCPFPPWPGYGLLPASIYLVLAGAWLWHLGAWEGMPK